MQLPTMTAMRGIPVCDRSHSAHVKLAGVDLSWQASLSFHVIDTVCFSRMRDGDGPAAMLPAVQDRSM
jgi:hypothetical protein